MAWLGHMNLLRDKAVEEDDTREESEELSEKEEVKLTLIHTHTTACLHATTDFNKQD